MIEGLSRQTKMSDIYTVRVILQHVVGSRKLTTYDIKKAVNDLATKCRSPKYFTRPTAAEALNYLQFIQAILLTTVAFAKSVIKICTYCSLEGAGGSATSQTSMLLHFKSLLSTWMSCMSHCFHKLNTRHHY